MSMDRDSDRRRSKSDPERGLTAYALLALNDRLLVDLGTQWLYAYPAKRPPSFGQKSATSSGAPAKQATLR
jgi:hypothetical protein